MTQGATKDLGPRLAPRTVATSTKISDPLAAVRSERKCRWSRIRTTRMRCVEYESIRGESKCTSRGEASLALLPATRIRLEEDRPHFSPGSHQVSFARAATHHRTDSPASSSPSLCATFGQNNFLRLSLPTCHLPRANSTACKVVLTNTGFTRSQIIADLESRRPRVASPLEIFVQSGDHWSFENGWYGGALAASCPHLDLPRSQRLPRLWPMALPGLTPPQSRSFENRSTCLQYFVSQNPRSVSIPLARLICLLMPLGLAQPKICLAPVDVALVADIPWNTVGSPEKAGGLACWTSLQRMAKFETSNSEIRFCMAKFGTSTLPFGAPVPLLRAWPLHVTTFLSTLYARSAAHRRLGSPSARSHNKKICLHAKRATTKV